MSTFGPSGEQSGDYAPRTHLKVSLLSEDEQLAVAEQDVASLDLQHRLPIGKHRLSLQDDVLRVDYDGDLTLEHVIRLHRIVQVLLARGPQLYVMGVVRREGAISPEATRWVVSWNSRHPTSCVALVGAKSAITRAVGSLIVRTINLFRKELLEMKICRTEEEALSYFEQQRRMRATLKHS